MTIEETDIEEKIVVTEYERLIEQKNRWFNIINEVFVNDSDRLQKLITLYIDYGDRLIEAPASSKEHYHCAYAGGFIDHCLHVCDIAHEQVHLLRKAGGMVDFTRAELVMSALNHDLWKLGLPNGEPYYIPDDSEYHRRTKGSRYMHNEKLPEMTVTDGAIYILQSRGIVLTYNEYLSIKLSDGMYDDANRNYYMSRKKFGIHSSLPYIIHWSDHMASMTESTELKKEFFANS